MNKDWWNGAFEVNGIKDYTAVCGHEDGVILYFSGKDYPKIVEQKLQTQITFSKLALKYKQFY